MGGDEGEKWDGILGYLRPSAPDPKPRLHRFTASPLHRFTTPTTTPTPSASAMALHDDDKHHPKHNKNTLTTTGSGQKTPAPTRDPNLMASEDGHIASV